MERPTNMRLEVYSKKIDVCEFCCKLALVSRATAIKTEDAGHDSRLQ